MSRPIGSVGTCGSGPLIYLNQSRHRASGRGAQKSGSLRLRGLEQANAGVQGPAQRFHMLGEALNAGYISSKPAALWRS